LSNAFKHAGRGETVAFDVVGNHPHDQDPGGECFQFGLYLETRAPGTDLSISFYVCNEQQTEKFSTGIGLAFTKELVSLMGADIQARLQNGWIDFRVKVELAELWKVLRKTQR
jgi:K+-sensing histidine kinase KdpD